MLQYLADINIEFGITVVIVTHEMEVIKALADNVAVMEQGRVVEKFAAAELCREGFAPTTSIGRYLVSDGISVRRAGARHHKAGSTRPQKVSSTMTSTWIRWAAITLLPVKTRSSLRSREVCADELRYHSGSSA